MMLHQLGNKSNNVKINNSRSNDLFAPPKKTTYKIINKQTRIIDDCIRSFDFEVNLDELSSESEIPTGATFIKGDRNTSILNARILKNGLPVDLSGITVTANVKESRTKTTIPAEVVDVNGVVQINLPVSIVDESGVNTFELVFQSGDRVVVSRTYSYKVLASLGEGSLGTNTEKTVLQTLIEQVRESKETSDTIIKESQEATSTMIEESQESISTMIQESQESVNNIIEEFKETSDTIIEESQEATNTMIEDCRSAISAIVNESQELTNTMIQDFRETSESMIEGFRNTSETIVEELEVTQVDIDDIIAMVGDL